MLSLFTELLQLSHKCLSVLSAAVMLLQLLAYVTLTFEIAISNRVCPPAELSRNAFHLRFQIQNSRFQTLSARQSQQNPQHGSHLARRTPRYVNEIQELLICSALESLGDVIRNGERRPLKLILQGVGRRKRAVRCKHQNVDSQFGSGLPNRQLFESRILQRSTSSRLRSRDARNKMPLTPGADWSGSRLWNLEFGIWNNLES